MTSPQKHNHAQLPDNFPPLLGSKIAAKLRVMRKELGFINGKSIN